MVIEELFEKKAEFESADKDNIACSSLKRKAEDQIEHIFQFK